MAVSFILNCNSNPAKLEERLRGPAFAARTRFLARTRDYWTLIQILGISVSQDWSERRKGCVGLCDAARVNSRSLWSARVIGPVWVTRTRFARFGTPLVKRDSAPWSGPITGAPPGSFWSTTSPTRAPSRASRSGWRISRRTPASTRHGCQMAIARFGLLDNGSATLRCKIWSLPFLGLRPTAHGHPRKGKYQTLPSYNLDLALHKNNVILVQIRMHAPLSDKPESLASCCGEGKHIWDQSCWEWPGRASSEKYFHFNIRRGIFEPRLSIHAAFLLVNEIDLTTRFLNTRMMMARPPAMAKTRRSLDLRKFQRSTFTFIPLPLNSRSSAPSYSTPCTQRLVTCEWHSYTVETVYSVDVCTR